MPIEPSQPIQLHVHLPEGTSAEPSHEHVHLYLHVTGTAEGGSDVAPSRDRPLRKAVGILLLVGLSAFGATWVSHHLGNAGTGPVNRPQANGSEPAPALPSALAHQLAQPGHVTPPPSSDPVGPAAFGLNP
ncbi:MAG: hypothetical protein WCC64_07890 [Aliidongia sp.]